MVLQRLTIRAMVDSRLRVLIDGSALPARPAGAGVYTLELARALTRRSDVEAMVAAPVDIAGVSTIASPVAGAARRGLWEQCTLPGILKREGMQLVHGAHFVVPVRSPVPQVATVHDLTFFRLPARYSRQHRWYYRALARLAARAERIIVPSRAVAGDAIRFLGYSPEHIRVVPEAPRYGLQPASEDAVSAFCKRHGIARPYLLCLGTAEPGKRAIDAIRALALLREQSIDVQLVLTGNEGPLSAALAREAARLHVGGAVQFTGYLPDDELSALLTGALALVFPSLYEGFGLPPLEAMACGTPVIASNVPAMNDVLEGAALFVPPHDPGAIAEHVTSLAADASYRREWGAKGREHASQFSWDRTAAETVDVYQELAL